MGSKDTNLSLNGEELSLLSDASFFIRKKEVTNKIIDLFGLLESEYDVICQKHKTILPEALQNRRGKISRGENYRGLPYVILDAPAIFEKKGVFAFRTLMWWGNPFSFTFHLSGSYLNQYLGNVYSVLSKLESDTLVCINQSQWEHHHLPTNYIPVGEFLESSYNNPEFFLKRGFLKLSKTVSLDEHPQLMRNGVDFLDGILNKLK